MMLGLGNGAGVIADVSYAVPNAIGFGFPYYWNYQVWGTKGIISFSAHSKGVELYSDQSNKVEIIKGIETDNDYLKDFVSEIKFGTAKNINGSDVFMSTRATLTVQEKVL